MFVTSDSLRASQDVTRTFDRDPGKVVLARHLRIRLQHVLQPLVWTPSSGELSCSRLPEADFCMGQSVEMLLRFGKITWYCIHELRPYELAISRNQIFHSGWMPAASQCTRGTWPGPHGHREAKEIYCQNTGRMLPHFMPKLDTHHHLIRYMMLLFTMIIYYIRYLAYISILVLFNAQCICTSDNG